MEQYQLQNEILLTSFIQKKECFFQNLNEKNKNVK